SLSEQFRREAETWSRLDHENIVKVLDYGIKPLPYIVMEYMPGGSLRDKLEKEGRPTISEAIRIAVDIGEALSYAHHMGVIHRDLKPENVLFTEDGRAKLTDFGLAKVMLQASMSSASGFKGTILYAAPEQVDPASYGSPDWRTDIWQYGALLYELLTGKPPFTADNPLALINKIINEEPPPPSHHNPNIPQWLDEIIMKCLRKKKEKRWKSIDLVLDRLYQSYKTNGSRQT
ncbi:MAG: serine/threonine protein kinase, partial [Desulfurococcales archaeon]|nr:serine/threonine protein kinase [Desulfurococcales archaeon]